MAFRKIVSKNPYTNQVIKEFPFLPTSELVQKIERSYESYEINKKIPLKNRAEKLQRLGSLIDSNASKYAQLLTIEMGKPINAALLEVKKCANQCRFYAEHGGNFVKTERVKTEAKKSLIEYHPLGPIYHLCPFNFPFWLAFKGCIPSLLLGNTILHRNSDSTPLCGLAIEELMIEAGFEDYEFQNVFTSPEQTETILAHKYIRGVSFTGSNFGGSKIAAIAGKYCKKSVMELGGSDPFIVLNDADIDLAVDMAVSTRLANGGQVCFSGKRFIIQSDVYEKFKTKLIQKVAAYKIGDPSNPQTQLGPLARADLVENISKQVQEGLSQGATLLYGGEKPEGEEYTNGNFYMPTICEVSEDNILFREETFGPVFALIKVEKDADIVRIANNTEYGLGCSIISRNTDKAEELGQKIESGSVFINDFVKSDSRSPSGGMKNSGYGRELGVFGMHEFANIKTVWVR